MNRKLKTFISGIISAFEIMPSTKKLKANYLKPIIPSDATHYSLNMGIKYFKKVNDKWYVYENEWVETDISKDLKKEFIFKF